MELHPQRQRVYKEQRHDSCTAKPGWPRMLLVIPTFMVMSLVN